MRVYALTVGRAGHKLREAPTGGVSVRQNSASGTTAQSTTMQEFAGFISGPLQTPVVDMTG